MGDIDMFNPTALMIDALVEELEQALANLGMTQEGKQWVANLYSHIFAEKHHPPKLGAERGPC